MVGGYWEGRMVGASLAGLPAWVAVGVHGKTRRLEFGGRRSEGLLFSILGVFDIKQFKRYIY